MAEICSLFLPREFSGLNPGCYCFEHVPMPTEPSDWLLSLLPSFILPGTQACGVVPPTFTVYEPYIPTETSLEMP